MQHAGYLLSMVCLWTNKAAIGKVSYFLR